MSVKDVLREIASTTADLVAEKNAAYGESFARTGRVMRELYPAGVAPGQLDDALAIVRVLDKLFRIATNKSAFAEDPWRDILGYALLSLLRDRAEREDEDRANAEVGKPVALSRSRTESYADTSQEALA